MASSKVYAGAFHIRLKWLLPLSLGELLTRIVANPANFPGFT